MKIVEEKNSAEFNNKFFKRMYSDSKKGEKAASLYAKGIKKTEYANSWFFPYKASGNASIRFIIRIVLFLFVAIVGAIAGLENGSSWWLPVIISVGIYILIPSFFSLDGHLICKKNRKVLDGLLREYSDKVENYRKYKCKNLFPLAENLNQRCFLTSNETFLNLSFVLSEDYGDIYVLPLHDVARITELESKGFLRFAKLPSIAIANKYCILIKSDGNSELKAINFFQPSFQLALVDSVFPKNTFIKTDKMQNKKNILAIECPSSPPVEIKLNLYSFSLSEYFEDISAKCKTLESNISLFKQFFESINEIDL